MDSLHGVQQGKSGHETSLGALRGRTRSEVYLLSDSINLFLNAHLRTHASINEIYKSYEAQLPTIHKDFGQLEEIYEEKEEALVEDEGNLAKKGYQMLETYNPRKSMFKTPTHSTAVDPDRSLVKEYYSKMGDAAILREKVRELDLEHEEPVQKESCFQLFGQQMDPSELEFLKTFDSAKIRYAEDLTLVEGVIRKLANDTAGILKHGGTFGHEVNIMDEGSSQFYAYTTLHWHDQLLQLPRPCDRLLELLAQFLRNYPREELPRPESGVGTCLPEGFGMRGQVWCERYHPSRFSSDCAVDDEERPLEVPSMFNSRVERILYLGSQLTSNRWLCYDTLTGHCNLVSPRIKSTFMKLFVWLGVFAALPFSLGHPTDNVPRYDNGATVLQTGERDSSISIDHAKFTIDEWPFIVVCVAITFAFLAFGLIGGFPLALGAGLFFSNACWLMAYNNPSTTPVVLASTFGLTLTFTCMFAYVEFRNFRHMKLGHGIAVFLTAAIFDYVWTRDSSPNGLGQSDNDSSFEYLMPCLGMSLVCWYWIAPFIRPHSAVREYYSPLVV